ncbi:hypothetical protein HPB49_001249 [Dermacentor silvarum]|uniref:Uncharacterized protein n=1 Tax=Dermacentor silvarum TaxID=543639 RepID=A0ACB8D9S3_DERSI|nr:hypothetical protein HPB49_001249 [Dermacentor silvarum]
MSKMRQPKYGTLSAVPVGLYGDPRCYGSVRGCCRRPGCTCGRRPEIDDAALYYHVLGASSLGAASLGRASLGRGHAPRRRSAASVHGAAGAGAAADVYLAAAAASDPLLRKLSRKDRFSSVSSRRSILECDVTAYDLIKKYLRTPAAPDSDDDDLNSNVLLNGAKKNGSRAAIASGHPSPRQSPAKSSAGTSSRPPASLELWPEEPDPDYDEDSDVGLEAGRFKDLKISYSPPLVRKVSVPAAPKTRADAAAASSSASSSSTTRRSQSCSPVRPATAAAAASSKNPTLSSQPRSILKKKKAPERKSLNATHRGRVSHGTHSKKVTFQEGGDSVASQAWEEEPWENPHEIFPETKKTRPRIDASWDVVATTASTGRQTAYVNGTARRRHGNAVPTPSANGAAESAQSRKKEATLALKADSKSESRTEAYGERRLLPREEKKNAKTEHKVEQQFNTEVRVRGNHKVEMKSHPRIDIRIEHTTENQSPKNGQKAAVIPVSSTVSFDSEPERQYHQVNGSFNGKGGVSVNCDVQASLSNRGTSINIVPCSEQKGISLEVNGSNSPCSSYEADADYEVISSYNSEDTKLTGLDAGKVATEQETKVAELKPSRLQEGILQQANGNEAEECKLSLQQESNDECLKDMREGGAIHIQKDMTTRSPEVPRSPQRISPPLSPSSTSNIRNSSEHFNSQVASNLDPFQGCKPDGSASSEPSDVSIKTDAEVNKTPQPQEPPVPTKAATVADTRTEETPPLVSECENSKNQVLPLQNAEHGVEMRAPPHGPHANDASKSTRPECPARKKHDLQKSAKGDSSKDPKSPPPRTGKPSPQRNANAKSRDTRIYQKVGVKVLPTKAEANSDVKLSLPMEHRISRPLSPPPPIPACSTSPRRVPAGLRCADESLAEGDPTSEQEDSSGTVMVTTQTSTGTRVLISSHGRLSGSYPVRRSPAKRRPRMRHSAPQLDGDSARALFAPLSLMPTADTAVRQRRPTPTKESTSTFYVSLSSSSSGELKSEEESDVPVAGRGSEAEDDEEEEPVYADTLPTAVCPPTPDGPIYDDCELPPEPLYEELPEHPPQPQHREKKLLSFESPQKSFFEGASKADILGYLEDAKERGLENLVGDTVSFEALAEDAALDKIVTLEEELVCPKCEKKRTERREIITEIVQTEIKYGHDLRIVKEEFYKPIETAGLLTKQQLEEIFLNLDELIEVNASFSEKLQDALDIASEQGDEEYTTVDIGKLFLGATGMLQAFQTYCVRQMENTLLRRMNLAAFLMAPVQRVTKYPLLLSRLFKVTPYSHQDRESLRDAQLQVQLHLERINQLTREGNPTKIWRRISSISVNPRRAQNNVGVGSIKLRKMALDLLKWNRDETRFVLAGRLLVAELPTSGSSGRGVRFAALHGLLAVLGRPELQLPARSGARQLAPLPAKHGNPRRRPAARQGEGRKVRPAQGAVSPRALLKEANDACFAGECVQRLVSVPRTYSRSDPILNRGQPWAKPRCSRPVRSGGGMFDSGPLRLLRYNRQRDKTSGAPVRASCTIELGTPLVVQAENSMETREWLKQLRYHAKDLGSWRRRRNGMANIMINGMDRY